MKAVILAAGKGTRLNSSHAMLPKVMREAAGRPLIGHVLSNLPFIGPQDRIVVVGFMKEQVMEYLGDQCVYAEQLQQLGTANAVAAAAPWLAGYGGDVLVCFGDMPLLTEATYRSVIEKHSQTNADATVLTAVISPPPAYGRIIRSAEGRLIDVIEQKDCTPEQGLIQEIHVGINVYKAPALLRELKALPPSPVTGEYYVTALPPQMARKGYRVETVEIKDNNEIYGVNTPEDLAFCEGILNKRKQKF